MAFYYNREGLEADLKENEGFLKEVVETGGKLKDHIVAVLKRNDLSGSVLYAGSTNPERLTAVIDPRSPDDRYPRI